MVSQNPHVDVRYRQSTLSSQFAASYVYSNPISYEKDQKETELPERTDGQEDSFGLLLLMNPRIWGCKVDIAGSEQQTKVCLVAYKVHVTINCALAFQGLGNRNRLQRTPPKFNLEKGICAG